ncbi:hypothetical protein ACS0TY_012005 [Phlomoides rotata]
MRMTRQGRLNTIIRNNILVIMLGVIVIWLTKRGGSRYRPRRRYTVLGRIPAQMRNMHALVMASDEDCRDQL